MSAIEALFLILSGFLACYALMKIKKHFGGIINSFLYVLKRKDIVENLKPDIAVAFIVGFIGGVLGALAITFLFNLSFIFQLTKTLI